MSATYRFVGDAPEVFLRFAGVMSVAGVERDAQPWRDGEPNPDYQPPGELRPGQEFELPDELYVRHARVERRAEDGEWVPTITAESPTVDDQADEQAGEQADEAEQVDEATPPRRRTRSGRQES